MHGIVIGTHALLSDRVQFADLGLLSSTAAPFGVGNNARL